MPVYVIRGRDLRGDTVWWTGADWQMDTGNVQTYADEQTARDAMNAIPDDHQHRFFEVDAFYEDQPGA